ncbi:uncharacterized protein LOC114565241 [Perca flavescens]|uniref:uncharacterized protein LOC114565241 n=1 Tax=Perca flavescens TaxID=8167 RepID=UPI00106EC210|nr:uncharacterized protein LOC114565241 [Perca flavescens]
MHPKVVWEMSCATFTCLHRAQCQKCSDGVWDVGPGKSGPWEGVLPYMQEKLTSHRYNTERPTYMQTPSTKNHTIERIWPEIKNRVNYPLKVALVQLVDQEALDMEDSMFKFCVSSLTCQLARLGIDRVVQAWNAHRISGKGIPSYLAREGCPKRVSTDLLPESSVAADWYEQEVGSLTRVSHFGTNPFQSAQDQEAAEREFALQWPDVSVMLDNAVNNQPENVKSGLQDLIDLTRRHCQR